MIPLYFFSTPIQYPTGDFPIYPDENLCSDYESILSSFFFLFFFLYWTQRQPPSLLLISRWKDLWSEPWELEEDRAGRDEEVLHLSSVFLWEPLGTELKCVKAPSCFLCWGDPLIACYQEMCKMGVRWFPTGPSFLCSIKKYIFTCQCLGSARVWLLENPSDFSKWMHLSKLQALWMAPPWSHP